MSPWEALQWIGVAAFAVAIVILLVAWALTLAGKLPERKSRP